MKSHFEAYKGLSDDEILRLAWANLGKENRPKIHVPQTGEHIGTVHDLWSVYAYGDEVRVVYYKTVTRHRSEEQTEYIQACKKDNAERRELELADYRLQRIVDMVAGKEVGPDTPPPSEERLRASISRTRSRVFELTACNEFTVFGTLTLDKNLRDRDDLKAFRKAFAQMVRDLNKCRDEPIKYVLIPEQHKNGGWHLHGVFMGLSEGDLRRFELSEKLPNKLRKQIAEGTDIFDWPNYRKRFGFCTLTVIRDRLACAKYVTKYVTKDLAKTTLEKGAHMYFASQGLKRREVVARYQFGTPPVDEWDFENDFVKIKTLYLNKIQND